MNQAQQFGVIFSIVFIFVSLLLMYFYLLARSPSHQDPVDHDIEAGWNGRSGRDIYEMRVLRIHDRDQNRLVSLPPRRHDSPRQSLDLPKRPTIPSQRSLTDLPISPTPPPPISMLPSLQPGTGGAPPCPPPPPPIIPPYSVQGLPNWYNLPWRFPMVVPSPLQEQFYPLGEIPGRTQGIAMLTYPPVLQPPPPPPVSTIRQSIDGPERIAHEPVIEENSSNEASISPIQSFSLKVDSAARSERLEHSSTQRSLDEPSTRVSNEILNPSEQPSNVSAGEVSELTSHRRFHQDSNTSLGLKAVRDNRYRRQPLGASDRRRSRRGRDLADHSHGQWTSHRSLHTSPIRPSLDELLRDRQIGEASADHQHDQSFEVENERHFGNHSNVEDAEAASPTGPRRRRQVTFHRPSPEKRETQPESPFETMRIPIPRLFSPAQNSEASNTVSSTAATTGHSSESSYNDRDGFENLPRSARQHYISQPPRDSSPHRASRSSSV